MNISGIKNNSEEKYIVTGASSGVGLALSRNLVQLGHRVCGIARSETKLKELQDQFPRKFFYILCDISDKKQVRACIQKLVSENYIPHVVILNAGINAPQTNKPLDMDALELNFKTNFFGTLYFLECFLNKVPLDGTPHFVTISSTASFRPQKWHLSYSASKEALNFVIEGLRLKLGPNQFSCTHVFLGPVDTPMLKASPSKVLCVTTADKAARSIIRGVQRNKKNIYVPWFSVVLAKILCKLPTPLFNLVVRVAIRD